MLCASARACNASDGRLTCVCSGFWGSAVAPSSEEASRTRSGSARTYSTLAWRVVPNSACAIGYPINAARSISGASGSGPRTPATVNQSPPMYTWTGLLAAVS